MSMSTKDMTPFDSIVPTNSGEPLRFIIASDSVFLRAKDTSIISNLCACAHFDEISLLFTPSNDTTVVKQLEEQNSNIISYNDDNGGFVIKVGNNQYNLHNRNGLNGFESIHKKVLTSQITYGEIALSNLVINRRVADYLVIDEEDFSSFLDHSRLLTPRDALEIIRLFMLRLEKFFVRENYEIDETGYYWYRVKTLFSSFGRVWSDSIGNEELVKWLRSLSDRLEFFCRSVDSIKIEALRHPNNLTSSRIQYHFNYLAVCIPSIYDNIAQYFNQKFDLKISNVLKIVLKKSDTELSTNTDSFFISALRSKCNELAQYIAQNDVQRKMQLIYPVRDGLMHRDQMIPVLYMDSTSKVKMNSFFASNDLYEKLVALEKCGYNLSSCFLVSNSQIKLINPVKFVSVLEEVTIDIVNSLLRIVPTADKISSWYNPDDMFHGLIPLYF